jgi:glyoxylase-like metal-dependent hydrolase (beta-lactamase superfamily II)
MKRTVVTVLSLFFIAGLTFAQSNLKTADANKRGLTDKDFPRMIKLANNVYAWEMITPQAGNAAAAANPATPPPSRVTTNSMAIVTTDGVMVVDAQGSPAQSTRLIEEIKKVSTQPIKYVVIGSPHGDHTSGNVSFPSTATFIAHPNAKTEIEGLANAPNRQPNAPKIIVPTELVSNNKTLKMGGTEIQILFLGRTHTGGDLAVYLPREKVLWLSESFNPNRFPTLRTGFPSEWVGVLNRALKMDVTYYVGAHGFIDDPKTMKTNLEEYKQALEKVIAEAKRLYQPGVNPDDAYKQANFGPYASWTDTNLAMQPAFKRAWDELDGKVK